MDALPTATSSQSSSVQHVKIKGDYSRDNLERMGYLLEMMRKFPKLHAAVYEDYNLRGQVSLWTCNKVKLRFCCILFTYLTNFIFYRHHLLNSNS